MRGPRPNTSSADQERAVAAALQQLSLSAEELHYEDYKSQSAPLPASRQPAAAKDAGVEEEEEEEEEDRDPDADGEAGWAASDDDESWSDSPDGDGDGDGKKLSRRAVTRRQAAQLDQIKKLLTTVVVRKHMPSLLRYEDIYRHLHRNPELSGQEAETSALVAKELRKLGAFTVKTHIGGYGVVGILANGKGKTVMLRADMDALPVKEATGLAYASTKTMVDDKGETVPVMHACGHDMHTTCLLAATELLLNAREAWSGTLIVLFQPAEEKISGAQRMVDDGLYDEARHAVPIPDAVCGQHVLPYREGCVGVHPGDFMTASASYRVRIVGRGGHATSPDACIDPILAAAALVTRLHHIIPREIPPSELGVLSVCSIHAGSASNIIPDTAELLLSTRAFRTAIHDRIDRALRRIAKAECDAAGCTEDPTVTRLSHTPATINDVALSELVNGAFADHFSHKRHDKHRDSGVFFNPPFEPGSEDVSVLARAVGVPYVYWTLGCIDGEFWDKNVKNGDRTLVPRNHSAKFAPVIHPTLRVGVEALAVAAMAIFDK